MRGKDGKLGFSEKKNRKKIWKNHKIMNEKNNWDHMVEANMVDELIEKVIHEDNKSMNPEKTNYPLKYVQK